MTECFICGRTNCFFKNVECLDYCCDCFEKLCCQKCNRGYDSCIHCRKKYVIVLDIKLNTIGAVI